MNFASYKREDDRLNFLGQIRLGGKDGLIARQIASLNSNNPRIRWIAQSPALIKLSDTPEADAILFINTGDANTFYELESVVAISSSEESEVVLRMRGFRGRKDKQGAIVPDEDNKQRSSVCESMILTGGYEGGTWCWREAPMGLGATIV